MDFDVSRRAEPRDSAVAALHAHSNYSYRTNDDDLVTDTRDGWSMEISKPQLLSKLPRAGLGDQARSKFCQVKGISDGRTRKRNEVCAAVDGDSVNVYEVS